MENIQGQTAANKKIKKSFADAGYRLDGDDLLNIDDVEKCCFHCGKAGFKTTTDGSYLADKNKCFCFDISKLNYLKVWINRDLF